MMMMKLPERLGLESGEAPLLDRHACVRSQFEQES
jgi:hypothetical protein